MKRRSERERDEEAAHLQADRRQEDLLAQLRAQEEASRTPAEVDPPEPDTNSDD